MIPLAFSLWSIKSAFRWSGIWVPNPEPVLNNPVLINTPSATTVIIPWGPCTNIDITMEMVQNTEDAAAMAAHKESTKLQRAEK